MLNIAIVLILNLIGFAIMDHVAPHSPFSAESVWIAAGAISFGLAGVAVKGGG